MIRLEGLGKKYRIHHEYAPRYQSMRDTLAYRFSHPGRRLGPGSAREDFWALRGIDLDIEQGERIGLIGRNGAGKSTLLKLISRITPPSEGRILLKGRVGTLLEVGTGFHPELTGRENIFLNGAILGMDRSVIRKRFDEIVAFAEIENFLDMPVKRYSSGMYMRLAFAVAAHLDPDILLVDEVLAVGDYDFQKKCLSKMSDISASGRTIVFISHNLEAISTLTNKCLVLNRGEEQFFGPTGQGIQEYLRLVGSQERDYSPPQKQTSSGIIRVEVRTSEQNGIHRFGQPLEIEMVLSAPGPIEDASVSFQIMNGLQQPVTHIWVFDSQIPMGRQPGFYKLNCCIPKCHLYMGKYTLTVHYSERFGKKNVQKIMDICPFEVVMHGIHREFNWDPNACQYLEDAQWNIKKMDS